ncbi:prokaryotic type I DNA topoisomerase [Leucogyrophana mollusca]|uniref:Prokaryotic type I DNA topoisomerase n=1 Tax=Leucogyrophana mollusca TaxID=85980 RepID=A0ACB8B7G2_9AGAM|nr:prokaryotic type I DNA topoisomerase [Leucogyrophana mollusca]
MRVLCVAEKPSIAKSISQILSGGNCNSRPSQNKFIRNFDFDYPQTNSVFTVTSVSGHLLAHDFPNEYRTWNSCDPLSLFDAPIHTVVPEDKKSIERNLMAEARRADTLMIWTDCDREGENIGNEIVKVCRKAKPRIVVKRARFSAIIAQQIHRAAQHPVELDLAQADAVDARIILDLRIGAAFTRMQTLTLQNHLGQLKEERGPVSYGPCQFPTLGFVVSRYQQVKAFVPENFWYILLSLNREDKEVQFNWRRGHIFDFDVIMLIYEDVLECPRARVVKVTQKNTKKWKPLPLTTVELQKAGSRLLKLAPKKVLDVAEKLYQQGFLSYPRTETDQYDPQFDFMTLIGKQTVDPAWGGFATTSVPLPLPVVNALLCCGSTNWNLTYRRLQGGGFNTPRKGKNNDKAHPPIHPTAHAGNLAGDEKKVYEFITRRFLACCSKDAEGSETKVEVEYGGEEFTATGLIVLQRNYLEVYPYDKWTGKEIPAFVEGEEFVPTVCKVQDGVTSAPSLLTEADLVTLMDKNGIGTDATIAQHIQTIVDREYVIERMEGATKHLLPSTLGIGLVEGYNQIGFDRSLSKPQLRRETERSMVQVCEGTKSKDEMLAESIEQYKDMFITAKREFEKVISSVRRYIGGNGGGGPGPGGGGGAGGRGAGGGGGGGSGDDSDGDGGDGRGRGGGVRGGRGRGAARGAGAPPSRGRGRGATRAAPPPPDSDDGVDEPPAPAPPPRAPISRSAPISRAPSQAAASSSRTQGSLNCDCGVPATRKVVERESTRKGEAFYGCDECGFFKWEKDAASGSIGSAPVVPSKRTYANSNHDHSVGPTRRCACPQDAVQRTVTKEGPNKGRIFWACIKGKDEGCQFFEWDDEPSNPMSRTMSKASACFNCNQEGHFASACPNAGSAMKDRTKSAGGNADSTCFKCGKPGHFSNCKPIHSSVIVALSTLLTSASHSMSGRWLVF